MQLLNKILDLPLKVEGLLKTNMVSDKLSDFNSQSGVRGHLKCIYNYASFVFLLVFLYGTIKVGFEAVSNSDGALSQVGSVLSVLLFVYAAFVLAKLIRSAGQAFDAKHDGVVNLIFKDFVLINVKLVGEFTAVLGLFSAFALTLAWLLNTALWAGAGSDFLGMVAPLYDFPMEVLGSVLNDTPIEVIGSVFDSLNDLNLSGSMSAMGDDYSLASLASVVMAYFGVILVLVKMYVSLAVYSFLYSLASTLVNWISSPSIPINMKK